MREFVYIFFFRVERFWQFAWKRKKKIGMKLRAQWHCGSGTVISQEERGGEN